LLRVTADSNIYISGLLSRRGNPYEFLELARRGKIRLAVSDAILDEVADVLGRKFSWPEKDIGEVRQEIERFAQKVTPAVAVDVEGRSRRQPHFWSALRPPGRILSSVATFIC
jgi:predicted nucleic acid-binding protein